MIKELYSNVLFLHTDLFTYARTLHTHTHTHTHTRARACIYICVCVYIFLLQIQELISRAQKTSNHISTEWEGLSQITSTYVIDCVRVEDQGLKYCVSVSKNVVAQSTPTVLLVNSKWYNNIFRC